MTEQCSCEYMDVGVGLILVEPIPGCPVHTMDVLTTMTYERHMSERSMGYEPMRGHWGHENCPCGCGPTDFPAGDAGVHPSPAGSTNADGGAE
jgi:hypothetical protein